MKILVLNYEYPPLGGGAGNITRQISQNLVKNGHKVLIVTTWFEGLPEHENVAELPEIIRLKSKRKYLHSSSPAEMYSWMKETKRFLPEYLTNNKFDICFANFSIPGGLVAKSIKKKFGIPYCLLSHGHDIPWYFKKQMFFYHLLTYFKIKSVCRESSYNFIQTLYMKKNIDRFLGKMRAEKNVIIRNGVVPSGIVTGKREKQPFTLLFVGRFVKQKDPITLLKAIRKLGRMDIPFRLFLIGDGPMRKKMERFVKKNDLGNVNFTGWIPPEEVVNYYQSAHTIITPSLAEGMSIANMEALAAGVFLIATPVSGNKEMLSCFKNGVLIDQGNYNEIANQLQKFYFEQYLPGTLRAQNTAEEFQKQNSWELITKKYEEKFQSICQIKLTLTKDTVVPDLQSGT